ncbi:sensor histidine kinase [Kitasatospora kifunensis]|uniref:histidine kinase n=1 Tax=Kitasatospora kifunensis TaxID=58351 RepID=A0A7W7R829_KITKI|nr:HAMP domain-containing sensor histidine kinase [Kitasatospora kifunensis]MBB4926546.1 two-component system sensor histidine kinase PrrB [Kitasatospora kifunensis]
MRLATRIAIWAAVLLPLLVLATSALLLGLVTHDLRNEQDAKLRDRAQVELPYVRAYLNADHQGRSRVEQNQHQKVLGAALDVGIKVADASGNELLAEGQLPAAVALPPATTNAAGPVTVRAAGRAWRVLARPVVGANPGTLWVAAPASATASQVSAVRGRIILVTLLAAPIAGLLAYGLARRATAPLSRLGRRAAALDPQAGAADFDHRHSGIGEVDELAAALTSALARYDDQAARTAQALETARSFSAAASHELRTPLMGLQTNLDVLSAHPDLPAADRAEILADLRADHRRLLDLLTALRTLARGDLVEQEAFGPLDLAEPVTAAIGELRRRWPELDLTVDLPNPGGPAAGLRVYGWEAGLRIVCDNLLLNAAVHGHLPGQPARVAVALHREADHAVLTVDDAGPGIAQAERAAVFDRFHRRRDSPGSGLGLTLVAQQVALHRGSVTVTTPPGTTPPGGTGCRFEVRLPLVSPEALTLPLPARRDWIGATG